MPWTDAYIGLRYVERGRGPAYDCLGLFLHLQAVRQGRVLPDPACTLRQAIRQRIVEEQRASGAWARTAAAVEGDALLFRLSARALHVAYAIDAARMLHIEHDAQGAVVEPFATPRWAGRLEGIYRFVG